VTADSLGYLSLEGMLTTLGGGDAHCHACFSGQYAIPFSPSPSNRRQMRLVGV
jgi:amidophosphoribosyltransferase